MTGQLEEQLAPLAALEANEDKRTTALLKVRG